MKHNKNKSTLKSSLPFKSKINIFVYTIFSIWVIWFIYYSGFYGINIALKNSIKLFIVVTLFSDFILTRFLIFILDKKKYCFSYEKFTDDLYNKIKNKLSIAGFNIIDEEKYSYIIIIKNAICYKIFFYEDNYFKIVSIRNRVDINGNILKKYIYKIAILKYYRLLKDIPLIVSIIQNFIFDDFDMIKKFRTKNKPISRFHKFAKVICYLILIVVVCPSITYLIAGIIILDDEIKNFIPKTEQAIEQIEQMKDYFSEYNPYIIEPEFNIKSYPKIRNIDKEPATKLNNKGHYVFFNGINSVEIISNKKENNICVRFYLSRKDAKKDLCFDFYGNLSKDNSIITYEKDGYKIKIETFDNWETCITTDNFEETKYNTFSNTEATNLGCSVRGYYESNPTDFSNIDMFDVLDTVCYFQKQIDLGNNKILHICLYQEYTENFKWGNYFNYTYIYDVKNKKYIKLIIDGIETTDEKIINQSFIEMIKVYYNKVKKFGYTDTTEVNCKFLYNALNTKKRNNYIYECVGKISKNNLFKVYEIITNEKGGYNKKLIEMYECNAYKRNIYIYKHR